MSNKYFQVLTAAAFLTTASACYGNLYYDKDIIGEMVTVGGSAVTGTFNISTEDGDGLNQTGFTPGSEQVTTAVAIFHLWDDYKTDDKRERETVSINLGSENLLSASSNGYVFGFFGAVGGFANVNMLIDLNLNGELGYSIESTQGDFYVNFAKLIAHTIEGNPRSTGGSSTRVPDGGATLAFLGLSVIGLACARRK